MIAQRRRPATRDELRRARATLPARDLPGADAARRSAPASRFPYISGLSLSLGVLARDPETGEERFARVKVPEGLPRFFAVGEGGRLLPLENVIAHFLDRLFPGMEIVERAVFRVTRDADFEVSDEADDLLEAVELELQRRRFGDVVRRRGLELDVARRCSSGSAAGSAPATTRSTRSTARSTSPTSTSSLDLDRPELKYRAVAPGVTPPRLVHAQGAARPLRGDPPRRLPRPPAVRVVRGQLRGASSRAAARDPDVIAMKTAVYRTSGDSPLVPALIQCAEEGKQSVCLVELKARFDEHRNIEWSRALEQAGVHVVYGFPDLKMHAKMTLVVRREGDGLRRYVHVGTGNYHAVTARSYEDSGLFTADPEIADDVADALQLPDRLRASAAVPQAPRRAVRRCARA